jgi:cytochrome c peroxidase
MKAQTQQRLLTHTLLWLRLLNKIDLNNLSNYANQTVPAYITKDNTAGNNNWQRRNLRREFFYDKNLSADNTVSCSSCHIQANAFGDVAT